MYSKLSKKEKQSKLAQARKRAILWSSQEQRRKNLQASAPVAQLSTLTAPIFYPAASELTSDDILTKPSPVKPNTPATTIAALQASLSDLLEQREQLDITIRVLQHRLEYLLSTTSHDE